MDEMDDTPPGQPTILMRITKVLVDHAKNKAWEMRDELEWMENNLEQKSDKLILKKIKKLKMEVTKKLEQICLCFFLWIRNMGWKRIDELEKKMLDNLDLEQYSDKLMMEEIKMLKMEVLKKLVKNLDCKPFFSSVSMLFSRDTFLHSNLRRNKELDVMNELEKFENMLDLEQKSDKLMMEELKNLKMEVMKNLVKNLPRELDCKAFFSSSNKWRFDAMDKLKKMEKMLDLEQESDKLMMEEIKMLKIKVMKELVKNMDYFSLWPTDEPFHAMDELKTMEKMLDLEQTSDKLMMEEIKMLKMEVMKEMVKNVDCFSLWAQPTNKASHAMDELKTMEKMLDLEQKSDKLMMEEIKMLKMEVMKNLVNNMDCHRFSSSSTDRAFHAMDELKTIEKMLDLEQGSDKLMMEKIKNWKMEVMKKLVKNLKRELYEWRLFWRPIGEIMDELEKSQKMLDYVQESDKLNMEELKMEVERMKNEEVERMENMEFSTSSYWREVLRELILKIQLEVVENMILTAKQKLRCEKRKAFLTKNSVYSKKGCSYSETCLSKKKTYSKVNCGYSDVFLSTDDNACSERVCNFSIQISKGKRPLAPASYSRNGVVYKAKKRNSCTEQLQGWTGITVIYLKIFLKVNYQIWILFMATYLVILKILQLKTTLQPKRIHFLTDCQLSLKTSGLKRQIFQLKTTTLNKNC
ncbi:uncharacterized protein LOC114541000 [Dendronephthya gigantea]|uniref:uncharacterized protein LOC114541000 n=1 Tax=Dendronephthya gigantea TaxID=151771 RepID=UPI00106B322B|nr:uncharacterized protein LOC114541000 [Dendronephthya gigantea]